MAGWLGDHERWVDAARDWFGDLQPRIRARRKWIRDHGPGSDVVNFGLPISMPVSDHVENGVAITGPVSDHVKNGLPFAMAVSDRVEKSLAFAMSVSDRVKKTPPFATPVADRLVFALTDPEPKSTAVLDRMAVGEAAHEDARPRSTPRIPGAEARRVASMNINSLSTPMMLNLTAGWTSDAGFRSAMEAAGPLGVGVLSELDQIHALLAQLESNRTDKRGALRRVRSTASARVPTGRESARTHERCTATAGVLLVRELSDR